MLASKNTQNLFQKNSQKYVNSKQLIDKMTLIQSPMALRYFCNSKEINYEHPTVKFEDRPVTRDIDIAGMEYTEHRDDIYSPDEMKYKKFWENDYMDVKKRIASKSYADDRYLFDHKIIPKKQLMSAYYSLEREGKVFHVFNAENIYWQDMIDKISILLRGKHKPIFKKCNADHGDVVIVVNLTKLKMPGKELRDKQLHYHTGYPGAMREIKYKDQVFTKPEMLLFKDVNRALPKNSLRWEWMKNQKAYRGPHHNYRSFLPHFAERPPMDKISLLPDGHFEDKISKIENYGDSKTGWSGRGEYDHNSYMKDIETPQGETMSVKHVEKEEEIKEQKKRVKKYFQYLRRTDDYIPKKRISGYDKYLAKKAGHDPQLHFFYDEKHVKAYKEDWILKQAEMESSGNED